MRKRRDALYPLAAAIGLVAVWQLGVQLLAIPDYLLPGPRAVAATVVSERTLIFQHGLITLYEAGLGFTLALVFAVPISAIIVWSKVAEKTVLPLMVFLQTVPKVAIAPLFIIWFGFGPFPKVLISFLLAYFPIVIEMVTGLRDVNPTVLDLARSMSITPFQTFTKIRIPNSLPYLFSGLKLGALLSLVGAIVAEFMGSMDGLGYLVLYANDRMDTTLCFAVLVVLLLLGKALFSVVEWVERYAIAWHVVVRENEQIMFTT
ncbi:MAG TPA: ABC transporter permease [Candidatus Latescibacteria bacterium]|nr:ABC transporter permease [Acidobacteriota bacterium]MDP7618628.1 ABC transporter permease [Dehalococcoidia bacterium]HCV22526.1 ABC transporter permease [Candidatus Latescibacterota bacterium]